MVRERRFLFPSKWCATHQITNVSWDGIFLRITNLLFFWQVTSSAKIDHMMCSGAHLFHELDLFRIDSHRTVLSSRTTWNVLLLLQKIQSSDSMQYFIRAFERFNYLVGIMLLLRNFICGCILVPSNFQSKLLSCMFRNILSFPFQLKSIHPLLENICDDVYLV